MCSVDGCERRHKAKGYCSAHYKRFLATGDPRPEKPIREIAGDGYLSHGYRYVMVPSELRHLANGETKIAEHRFVMAKAIGRALLPEEQVHHRNGKRLDNRLANLELWSTAHPSGSRVEDLLEYALRVLVLYGQTGIPYRLGRKALETVRPLKDGAHSKGDPTP